MFSANVWLCDNLVETWINVSGEYRVMQVVKCVLVMFRSLLEKLNKTNNSRCSGGDVTLVEAKVEKFYNILYIFKKNRQ